MRTAAVVIAVLGCAAAFAQEEDGIPWIHSYEDALAQAKEANKPLFIEFYADWCGPCRQMDAEVYSQPEVVSALEGYVAAKVDVDQAMHVAAAYQVNSIPRFVVVSETGKVIGDQIGFVDKKYFLNIMNMIAEDGDAGGQPMPEVTGGPEPEVAPEDRVARAEGVGDWLALLGDADPKVREAAGEKLAAQGGAGAAILVEALASDYLGTRIGAYEALTKHELAKLEFDPWAEPDVRDEAIRPWREWRDEQVTKSGGPTPPAE
jgi:thioredoxin-related protein